MKVTIIPGYLSSDFVDKIIQTGEKNPYNPGLVLDLGLDPNRVCELANIDLLTEVWLANLLSHVANYTNANYGFHLSYPREASVTKYNIGGHYKWHHDIDWRSHPVQRKVSISVQLTDPTEYEGGDLEFQDTTSPDPQSMRQKGTVIVFPSYVVHRVTPVTKGVRKALVSWIEGPAWR